MISSLVSNKLRSFAIKFYIIDSLRFYISKIEFKGVFGVEFLKMLKRKAYVLFGEEIKRVMGWSTWETHV